MNLHPQTTAFVFPGQGSQAVGMGKELAETYPIAKRTFDEADSILGFALSQLMWNGPADGLNETINTQPALYLHSIAAWKTTAIRSSGCTVTSDSPSAFPTSRLSTISTKKSAQCSEFLRSTTSLWERAAPALHTTASPADRISSAGPALRDRHPGATVSSDCPHNIPTLLS